ARLVPDSSEPRSSSMRSPTARAVRVIARSSRLSPSGRTAGPRSGVFPVVRGLRPDLTENADHRAGHDARRCRRARADRILQEGHELAGEARHRAADTDAADVRAAAHPVDPAALGHVALDHLAPAAQLDQAFGRTMLFGELVLLVVPGPVTAFVDGVL